MIIEKYCLECGETVQGNKCDYCNSDNIDVMNIEDIV
jgi:hypothetical protein